ncbi:hypothetical protein KI387_015874, partial [Taxus chinensis]
EAIENRKSDAELKFLCQKMDSEGVWKYMAEHRRDVQAVTAEMRPALESVVDPARLVLEAIEEKGMLRAVGIVVAHFGGSNSGGGSSHCCPGFKERAKAIVDKWKSKIVMDRALANAKLLEVQVFLQLLATFGIAAEFDRDFLRKLVMSVSWRKYIAKLCGALGLSEIMPVEEE